MRTRVKKIETMYGRSRVHVKVEPCSTFTFTLGLSYIVAVSFTHVNFTCVRTEKLRDSGNQPKLISYQLIPEEERHNIYRFHVRDG